MENMTESTYMLITILLSFLWVLINIVKNFITITFCANV